jgi:hypothetical protein
MSYGTVQAEKMTTESGYSLGAGNASSFKNRIINGGMVIDQRNAGAAVTTTGTYPVDRFQNQITYGSLSFQQSSTAPAGFKNSVAVTVTTGGTVSASDRNAFAQWIEGYNIADLDFGTASAKSVTLSFWVRSSLTGTFSGCLSNNVINRSFVFTYTISAANTWEQKTITIVGETTGTWQATTGQGLRVAFDLGTGTDRLTSTTNAWQNSDFRGATGAVQLSNTTGATWFVTGVQLEVGTVATSFDFRSIGTELALCQRYLPAWRGIYNGWCGQNTSTTGGQINIPFPVTARTAPTGLFISSVNHLDVTLSNAGAQNCTAFTFNVANDQMAIICNYGVASGLTAGHATNMRSNSPSFVLYFNGCEL